MFLIRSELSITAYFFLVLYRSTSLQSLSFLKNIETFLSKVEIGEFNQSIPSKQQRYNHNSFSKTLRPSTALPYSHNRFSKILRTLYASRNQGLIVLFLQRTLKKNSFTPHPSLSSYSPTDGITERQIHTLRVGWRNFFSSCAVVSVFLVSGEKQILVLLTYVSRVQQCCGVVLFFWFWWEIVFGVTYVLSAQYSCAVVSVFLLWREIVLWWEIVLKMRTPFDFL